MKFDPKTIVLIVFIGVYIYLIASKKFRGLVVWIGASICFIFNILSFEDILHFINWNVIGIFIGTLIIAELFVYSQVPALIANYLVENSKTVGMAILLVCIVSGFLSAFVENVATVLIVAPIALELSRKLKVSPVPFLIGIAISSNLQGTATLIGDPPSMILAAYERMNFNDFFIFHGKPSIFFAVQAGAIASFIVLYLIFRRFNQKTTGVTRVEVRTWKPTYVLIVMIILLALSPLIDPEFKYLGGVICIALGIGSLIYHYYRNSSNARAIIKRYDWDTTLFLAGVFVLVGLLEDQGIVDDIKDFIVSITGKNPLGAFGLIVSFSVLISAFICNVPYITAMIPVVQKLSMDINGVGDGCHYLLVFGLLIGSCLGGNITPIGASANIVATGLLKRDGYPISFMTFVKIGLPFTLAATIAGSIFLLLVWQSC